MRPVTPWRMISSAAPFAPIHAFPARIASRNTRPKPSSRLGMTRKRHCAYSAASSRSPDAPGKRHGVRDARAMRHATRAAADPCRHRQRQASRRACVPATTATCPTARRVPCTARPPTFAPRSGRGLHGRAGWAGSGRPGRSGRPGWHTATSVEANEGFAVLNRSTVCCEIATRSARSSAHASGLRSGTHASMPQSTTVTRAPRQACSARRRRQVQVAADDLGRRRTAERNGRSGREEGRPAASGAVRLDVLSGARKPAGIVKADHRRRSG